MKKGDIVVCINDSPGWVTGTKKLVNGKEYVVLFVHDFNGPLEIRVEHGEPTWSASRFRKIEPHSFSNAITKELAKEIEVQQPDYAPKELEPQKVEK